jgi:TPP-dependent pyruvate/acetoin dehydrogenase alpha subunit
MTQKEALGLYRKLLFVRKAEERIKKEYPKDQIKTPVHLGIGGEAIAVGVCHCLPENSKTFGTYRNHALYLTVSGDAPAFFGELFGKVTGPSRGKAGSMHLCSPQHGLLTTSAVVGTPIPVAVGAALASAYRGDRDLSVVFFGDGAIEEGVFWESLNFACLHKLRMLFVCEDNGLAIHTPSSARQGFRSIPEVVAGFNCHVATGDGSDINKVVDVTREMLARMDSDPRPGFLHFTYLRYLEHVGPSEDFNAGYRTRPAAFEMEQKDPVLILEKQLVQDGTFNAEIASIKTAIDDEIEQSVRAAQVAAFPAGDELYTDLFV